MASSLVISMTLWWIVAVPLLSAAIGVLVFLARHPVDGETRIVESADRNRVPCALGGGVLFYLVFPSAIMLVVVLFVFWGVARFGTWEPEVALRDRW